jgi:hypothetical protein
MLRTFAIGKFFLQLIENFEPLDSNSSQRLVEREVRVTEVVEAAAGQRGLV